MYHHSASAAQSAVGFATSVLDPVPAGLGRTDRPKDAIVFQRCTWCATAMYHRLLCPVCQGSDLRTEHSEGTGTVRHSTVVHRNTPAARNVSLIEMAEGFVVRGRVMGPPIGIHSGDRVKLSTAKDPVRGEPVFQLLDEPYRAWS
ncbi:MULTISPECIES: zinc ribbon domain-containing protein [unclassified Streptomyces]|uniref:Zn-ribbon domain-containing OB-fold protein n=1 Tax=unclassified Streptomyces TaxID=2593676 RepID=UPI003320323B